MSGACSESPRSLRRSLLSPHNPIPWFPSSEQVEPPQRQIELHCPPGKRGDPRFCPADRSRLSGTAAATRPSPGCTIPLVGEISIRSVGFSDPCALSINRHLTPQALESHPRLRHQDLKGYLGTLRVCLHPVWKQRREWERRRVLRVPVRKRRPVWQLLVRRARPRRPRERPPSRRQPVLRVLGSAEDWAPHRKRFP